MNKYRITISQIINNEIRLEDIRDIFSELGIRNIHDFEQMKKSGYLKIPSYDNLNALCKEMAGEKFEKYFFGKTEINLKIEKILYDNQLIEEIKRWCSDNNIVTLNDYRIAKRPNKFPTYKATVDNYGEKYFYDILGLHKRKPNFSSKLFDEKFIITIREWCIRNDILSKNDYQRKKPNNFPSLETIRQLTGKSNYFKEVLKLDF